MRFGEGIRNALIVLILIACAHVWIQRHAKSTSGLTPHCNDGAGAARRGSAPFPTVRVPAPPVPPSGSARSFVDSWPSPPEDIEWASAKGPSPQKPYTTEEEERAALHRLVFAGVEQRAMRPDTQPKLLPDYSGLHMAAEQSCQLPMFDIAPKGSRQNTDCVSGIESWGAGYAAL